MKRRRILRRHVYKKGGKCDSGSFGTVCDIDELKYNDNCKYVNIYDIYDQLIYTPLSNFKKKFKKFVFKEFNKITDWQGVDRDDLNEIINVNYMGSRLSQSDINKYTTLNSDFTRFQYGNTPYLLYKKMQLTGDMTYEPDIIENMYAKLSEFIDIMQSVGIRHNDIKPDNILMDSDVSYLGDFGTLTFTNDNNIFEEDANLIIYGNGTPRWVHPLMMSKVGGWGSGADILYKKEYDFYVKELGFTFKETNMLFTYADVNNNCLIHRDRYALILSILYFLNLCENKNEKLITRHKLEIIEIDRKIKTNPITDSILFSIDEENPYIKDVFEPPPCEHSHCEPPPNPFMNFTGFDLLIN